MKIRQRVKLFDELNATKARLTAFITTLQANNAEILSSESEDEEVVAAKAELTKIIAAKQAKLDEVNKEIKDHNYFFRKTKTDLEKYRGTVEYIGEDD
jgi:peptidoglycan hydrolase CwlO-like protein